ncbi:MAG: F0F1 ATP synthase subunit B [Acidimicrobiales bacterium]|jgi:F-type H+-transporting ATPase subunit b
MLAASKSQPVFLIPNFTFVLELVAFLAILYFFARVILPPLRRAMNEREQQIRNSIEAAEEARREAAESLAQRREALEAARVEARQIVDQANEVAEQLRDEGRQRGQQEYERLLHAAQSEIELERQRARDEVMSEVGDLVLRAAERVIGGALDSEQHRALVDQAIAAAQPGGSAG